jgi:hypothetical protein
MCYTERINNPTLNPQSEDSRAAPGGLTALFYDVYLSDALWRKLEVNERKYPVDKSFNSHRKYTQLR